MNAHLDLLLYRNQFQLATSDAIYSDGDRYRPAIAVTDYLLPFLPGVKTALVLGGGLASMVYVLRGKGFDPAFTIVEKDKVVLRLAMELFEATNTQASITPVCTDAQAFMEQNKASYDLVFIDVFMGRVVPAFVTTAEFLSWCKAGLSPHGRLAFNYIINDEQEWEKVQQVFALIFPEHKVLDHGINRIFVV